MPEWLKPLFEGQTGAIIASILGAIIRGLIGPGAWRWGEFFLASFTAVVFALWVVPGVGEYLELGRQMLVASAVVCGMMALPLSRGVIALGRRFRDHPEDFIRFGNDDEGTSK